jgi:hypothetical protein
MSFIVSGIAVAGTAAGMIAANQERQRKKGIIGQAAVVARQRMDLKQQDTRQSMNEGLLARGLGQGGGVQNTGPVNPGNPGESLPVSGAHTLGGQQDADLAREQQIEQTGLKTGVQTAYSDVNAAADQAMVGSVIQGANSAAGIISARQDLNTTTPKIDPAASAGGLPAGVKSMGIAPDSPYGAAAYGGIDPVHPLERGAWAQSGNDTFNVNG